MFQSAILKSLMEFSLYLSFLQLVLIMKRLFSDAHVTIQNIFFIEAELTMMFLCKLNIAALSWPFQHFRGPSTFRQLPRLNHKTGLQLPGTCVSSGCAFFLNAKLLPAFAEFWLQDSSWSTAEILGFRLIALCWFIGLSSCTPGWGNNKAQTTFSITNRDLPGQFQLPNILIPSSPGDLVTDSKVGKTFWIPDSLGVSWEMAGARKREATTQRNSCVFLRGPASQMYAGTPYHWDEELRCLTV